MKTKKTTNNERNKVYVITNFMKTQLAQERKINKRK